MLCLPYLISLLSSSIDSLIFYVFLDNLNRCTTCCKQAKALTPKVFFPKLLSYLWKFFFQKPTACTFVGIYELADFRIGMCFEQNMHMIFIMIPFLQSNIVIRSYILEDFFCTVGNIIIKHFPSIFYNKYKMIVQQKY